VRTRTEDWRLGALNSDYFIKCMQKTASLLEQRKTNTTTALRGQVDHQPRTNKHVDAPASHSESVFQRQKTDNNNEGQPPLPPPPCLSPPVDPPLPCDPPPVREPLMVAPLSPRKPPSPPHPDEITWSNQTKSRAGEHRPFINPERLKLLEQKQLAENQKKKKGQVRNANLTHKHVNTLIGKWTAARGLGG
jgi:hypothetical protein